MTRKKEFIYLLKNDSEMGYSHLLSGLRCGFLAGTTAVFIVLQLIIFCSLDWNNPAGIWDGLNPYQKFVAALFQVTNSRHSGESVVDISVISPAILVVFVVMMWVFFFFFFFYTIGVGRNDQNFDVEVDNFTLLILMLVLLFKNMINFFFPILVSQKWNPYMLATRI